MYTQCHDQYTYKYWTYWTNPILTSELMSTNGQ